ncbi:hypothetical protein GALMADRAFT_148294 [Galerina marginata CBS 339.88]|uniref:Uncharacterized protein n=1 Tax=Galerina marginata (strain CBS 339.88) TaxID=685588 RepID=A0A067S4Z0_GALM3|nr:hypothetical protein GALMADRAFT_148294 [Galerina marginata CBS 339.88]
MNNWDELCILCGISPNPPRKIYPTPEFGTPEFGAQDLADKLIKHDPSILEDLQFEKDELVERLRDALTLDSPHYGRPGNWEGFTTCVAVGHFYKKNDIPRRIVYTESSKERRIPDGVKVMTRVVEMPSCGDFNFDILRNRHGHKLQVHKFLSCSSSTRFSGDSFGNFFLSEACFHYLEAWIDQSQFVPGTRARSLSFAGELYEVVNSRKRGRVNGVGTLQWMDYGGIENTLVRTQSYLHRGLKVPKYTAAAIRSKSTRQRVFDAILRDCGSWKFDALNS